MYRPVMMTRVQSEQVGESECVGEECMVAMQAFCVSVYARPQCSGVCLCEYVIDLICARMCVRIFWQLYVIIVYMRGITLYSGVRLVQGGGDP